MSRLMKKLMIDEDKGDATKVDFHFKNIRKDMNELLLVSRRVMGNGHKYTKDLEKAMGLINGSINPIKKKSMNDE